jgi:hypothetical protein
MEMVLLDWTRMGRTYCVAGAARVGGQLRIIRPLPRALRDAPVRNTGWTVFTRSWTNHKATIQPFRSSGSAQLVLIVMCALSAL